MKFRSKPKIIEAEQFTENYTPNGVKFDGKRHYVVTIQEQKVQVIHGEWIVQERNNPERHYPIAEEEFPKLYEPFR